MNRSSMNQPDVPIDAGTAVPATVFHTAFDSNPASETQIGDYYIMIPQEWAGEIVVDADCLFWLMIWSRMLI